MLSCVSCVSAKHTSGMVGAGLLEFCNLPLSQASIRATRHHNSKWPECNCGPAILDLTSFLSQTCNNITLLGKQTCIPGIAKCSMQGPIYLVFMSRDSREIVLFFSENCFSFILLGTAFRVRLFSSSNVVTKKLYAERELLEALSSSSKAQV